MRKVWQAKVDGRQREIVLEHGYWSGRRRVWLDGRLVVDEQQFLDSGSSHTFPIGAQTCTVQITIPNPIAPRFAYACGIDDVPLPGSGSLRSSSHFVERKTDTEVSLLACGVLALYVLVGAIFVLVRGPQ